MDTTSATLNTDRTALLNDKDSNPFLKFLAIVFAIMLLFGALLGGIGLLVEVISPLPDAPGLRVTYAVMFVICGVLLVICYRYGKRPSSFRPRTGVIAPDVVSGLFDVRPMRVGGRTLQGKGYIQFQNNELAISGTIGPKVATQLLVIVAVTVIPLILFRVALGLIPALILANYLGKEEIALRLPYKGGRLAVQGRTVSATVTDHRIQRIKFRIAASDGERFYRELERKISLHPDVYSALYPSSDQYLNGTSPNIDPAVTGLSNPQTPATLSLTPKTRRRFAPILILLVVVVGVYLLGIAVNSQQSQMSAAVAHNNQGMSYDKQGQEEQAILEFDQALALDPKLALTYSNRGYVQDKQGNEALALQDLNQAIALDPNLAMAYNNRGNIYFKQSNFDGALADFKQAIVLDPKLALAYNNLGWLYYNEKQESLALADFNQAIALDPMLAQAFSNRGLVYYDQGHLDLALTDINQAIALQPTLAQPYNNRGLVYTSQDTFAPALDDFNKAIALDPKVSVVYTNRGYIYFKQSNFDMALSDFGQAIALDPTAAVNYAWQGAIYYRNHQDQEALLSLRQYSQLAQDKADPKILALLHTLESQSNATQAATP